MTRRAAFAETYNVPRGTLNAFDRYAALLVEWQATMNLVGPSTLAHIWDRHFADSAQLAPLAAAASDGSIWLDFGSGAGFPALVLALMTPGHFHLVEATAKKCRFLDAVVAEVGLGDRVTVHNTRIESLPPLEADFITARACAAVTRLFEWGLAPGRRAKWLLPKGRSAMVEVAAARRVFDFEVDFVASKTDEEARIVVARNVRRRSR